MRAYIVLLLTFLTAHANAPTNLPALTCATTRHPHTSSIRSDSPKLCLVSFPKSDGPYRRPSLIPCEMMTMRPHHGSTDDGDDGFVVPRRTGRAMYRTHEMTITTMMVTTTITATKISPCTSGSRLLPTRFESRSRAASAPRPTLYPQRRRRRSC
ncbi:hypothetical protein F5X99DRAFT_151672 [Biscogniauxia marginata]|nr:hypothetical protein F5X99DRAFT_151672 [Biscogniauxia marginata]